MAWETMLIRKYVEFWGMLVEPLNATFRGPVLVDKLEYWKAETSALSVPGMDSYKGVAARSNYASIKARNPPTIDGFEQVLRACLQMGRYDVAYSLAKQMYTGVTTKLTSDCVKFRKYPGPAGVILDFPGNKQKYRRTCIVPGLAGEIIYTWWALHGGWHYKGLLYEPMDINYIMRSTSNPFTVAGVEYITLAELRSINRNAGSVLLPTGGITNEHLGYNKYWQVEDVVYVKDGAQAIPLGFAHKNLSPIPTSDFKLTKRAWGAKWVAGECAKLGLTSRISSLFAKYAREIDQRLRDNLKHP